MKFTGKELLLGLIYLPLCVFMFALLLFIGFMQWLMEDSDENS